MVFLKDANTRFWIRSTGKFCENRCISTHFTYKLLITTTHTFLRNQNWNTNIRLLTMYNVWSWSSRLSTACLNRRTKSLKLSQGTREVCSVSEEQLCNWMRISSKRSREVKYSTQFTNTWGSWRGQKKIQLYLAFSV